MTLIGVDPQPVLPPAEDMQARIQAAEADAALKAMKLYKAFRSFGFWTLNAAHTIFWAYVAMWFSHWLGWLPTPWG